MLGLACPRSNASREGDAGAKAENGGTHPLARPQIRVPLPEGWAALVTPDGNLRAGPPGRPLMRIDREAGAAAELPSAEALKSAFASGLKTFSVKGTDLTRTDGFVGLRLTLARTQFDGGTQESFAGLGARRAGTDLFLCSTSPGTATAEVTAALKSCAGIGTATADSP